MTRSFRCRVWISASVLLYGSAAFTSNIPTQSRPPNVTVVGHKENPDFDSSFLQLRADLLSYSRPIRPYNLPTDAEEYHDTPKPRLRRPPRLLRLLGSSFDPFWMSIEKPSEASERHGGGQPLLSGDTLPAKLPNTARQKCDPSACPVLSEAAANHRQKLERDVSDLDLDSLPSRVASSVRDWLVRSATCGLSCQWVDLVPTFWPRWLRQTDCERSDGVRGCSFPGGMECVQSQTTHLKILAWHCLEMREADRRSPRIKADRSAVGTVIRIGDTVKRCLWREVPYPVVTACRCSCR